VHDLCFSTSVFIYVGNCKQAEGKRTVHPWTVDETGHYVGHDGFVCPKSFAEFVERFPGCIPQWAAKHSKLPYGMHEDLAAEIALKFLIKQTIEKFDPAKRGGCNAGLFFGFIRFCCARESQNIVNKMSRDAMAWPIIIPEKLPRFGLASWQDDSEWWMDEATDREAEEALIALTQQERFEDFKWFLAKHRPRLVPFFERWALGENQEQISKALKVPVSTVSNRQGDIRLLARQYKGGIEPRPHIKQADLPVVRRRKPYGEKIELKCSNPKCGKSFVRRAAVHNHNLKRGRVFHCCSLECNGAMRALYATQKRQKHENPKESQS
jgi:hypothetical protein